MSEITRRDFVSGGAALVAAGAAATMVGYQSPKTAKAEEVTEWAAEADVVIIGTGFAGLSAAITAKTEFPDVTFLLFDAAPTLDEIGGNSRVCGQIFTTMDDVQGAIDYLNECNGGEDIVEQEYVQAWAEHTCEIAQWVMDLGAPLGINQVDIDPPYNGGIEYPEFHGGEHITTYVMNGVVGSSVTNSDGAVCGELYAWAYDKAKELGVEMQIDTRIVDFVLDEATREIRGVMDEKGNAYKARKGVIMACGGFENDLNTIRQYLPLPVKDMHPAGTPYNRGDGLRMAQSVNAQLWHMNNFASFEWNAYLTDDFDWAKSGSTNRTLKDFVFIGPRGKRFMYEERCNFLRHGKSTWMGGVYSLMPMYTPAWMVFGQSKFEGDDPVISSSKDYSEKVEYQLAGDGTNASALEQGIIVKGETLEELAANMGLDERWVENFVNEITTYNEVYVPGNYDYDYERGTYFFDDGCPLRKEIEAFDLVAIEPPYYAVRLVPRFLNTQGGPKHNGKSEVLDLYGEVIPRLYTAGELGAIYANDYNGGFNVCECWSTGREAMRNCAQLESWE